MRLSEEELGIFGSNAKQHPSHFHVMIEAEDYMYKLVHESKERVVLFSLLQGILGRITDRQAVHHFIVPEFCQPHLVKYSKLPYGPLDRLQATKFLKTFVEKVDLALTELHNMGIAHSDVHLPNICFNHQYDAVLIDMERCCDAKKFPDIAVHLQSCMYTQLKRDFFSGERMDYMQLGWLVAWVLSDKDENGKSDYHDRSWSTQIVDIRNDTFVKKLVCCGEYSRSDLNGSFIVVDKSSDLFSTLFLS